MEKIVDYALFIAIVGIIISALLCLIRIWRGPTAYDRLNALSLIGINTMLIIVLMGHLSNQLDFYVDISITYAMTGFITMIVLSKYLIQRSLDAKNNSQKKRGNTND